MFKLAEFQTLEVKRFAKQGIYLFDPESDLEDLNECVLLPLKQVPEGIAVGDTLEVFIYLDSSDRIIATTNEPYIAMGDLAPLKVVQVNQIGAFLDWGLEKDLFLPFKEQRRKLNVGDIVFVSLYIDKTGRIASTMSVVKYLRDDSPYKVDDMVKCLVYEINPDMGVFLAVDMIYNGMIAKKDVCKKYTCGEIIELRVSEIRPDGKLFLSERKKAYLQMEDDIEVIMEKLKANGGKLPLNDKSKPELIKRELGMSKAGFKRAVGRLMKEKIIRNNPDGIELV